MKQKDLFFKVKKLVNSDVKLKVDNTIKTLEKNFFYNKKILSEMFFCILTANFDAEKTIFIQKNLNSCFFNCSLKDLKFNLKKFSYRYPNVRAEYIFLARKKFYENIKEEFGFDNIKSLIKSFKDINDVNIKVLYGFDEDSFLLRDFFVSNVKGFSYKEASHFLRNIGFKQFSIVDFHIIDILKKHSFLEENAFVYTSGKNKGKRKSLSKKDYYFVENILKNIAKKLNLNLSELDFYLWYLETGKILK